MSRVSAIGSATSGSLVTHGDGGGGQEEPEEEQGQPPQKKTKQKAKGAATAPSGRDTLERQRRPTGGVPASGSALSAGIAVEGEGQGEASIGQQLTILKRRLAEAESAFEFMGTGHPEYERRKREVDQLRGMVQALGG